MRDVWSPESRYLVLAPMPDLRGGGPSPPGPRPQESDRTQQDVDLALMRQQMADKDIKIDALQVRASPAVQLPTMGQTSVSQQWADHQFFDEFNPVDIHVSRSMTQRHGCMMKTCIVCVW